MARNAHIRQEHVEAIKNIIFTWDKEKMDWNAVCAAAEPILGYRPSRSGLSSHDELLKSFQSRKLGLKARPPQNRPLPGSLAAAAHQLAAKDAEINALKKTINGLMEQFERWEYNAYLRRVTLEQLNEPLPHIDRTR
jgi:hypothetical protein